MNAYVSIRFSADVTVELRVPFNSGSAAQTRARDWLDRTYQDFGCEPARPIGKVLLSDKILAIAEAAGEEHFQRDSGWSELYAQAVSSGLDRTRVEVDVEGRTVSS